MKKRNVVLFLLFMFLLWFGGRAQKLGTNTQFMFNRLVINPAYAGIHDNLRVDLIHERAKDRTGRRTFYTGMNFLSQPSELPEAKKILPLATPIDGRVRVAYSWR